MSHTTPTSHHPSSQQATDLSLLSLEAARRVIWQTTPKEPIGQLLDTGQLTRRDLVWAMHNAYRDDVRRAAHRLLEELDTAPQPQRTNIPSLPSSSRSQPQAPTLGNEAPRYGPRVVTASEYLEEQDNWHGWMLAYYVGLGVGVLFFTGTAVLSWFYASTTLLTAVSIVGTVIAWIWLVWLIRRQIGRVRSYRAGRKGEAQVLDALRQSLDQRWTIYRGLQLPTRRDDLDLVLVGPAGVWVVQVKAFRQRVRVQNGRWEYQRGKHWRPVDVRFNPAKVGGQAAALSDFLTSHGTGRWVDTAIALTEPQPAELVASSKTPVWLPFEIEQRARTLATRMPPRAEEVVTINDLLGRRAIDQQAEHRGHRRR